MKRVIGCVVLMVFLCAGSTALAQDTPAQDKDGVGIRAGIGTDITGDIAFGAEIGYVKLLGKNALEMALGVFGGNFKEESEEMGNTYFDTTKVLIVGVLVNYLLDYGMDGSKVYFVLGAGAGAISYEWAGSSPTDPTYNDSEDGTSGGSIINLGLGYRFSPKFDLRFQAPIFFIWSAPGSASAVAPTFTLSAGLRF